MPMLHLKQNFTVQLCQYLLNMCFVISVAFLLCISWIACHLMHVGRILLMLGKAQFELQKLVDSYVSPVCRALAINFLNFKLHLQT